MIKLNIPKKEIVVAPTVNTVVPPVVEPVINYKLTGLETCTEDYIDGIIESPDTYFNFRIHKESPIIIEDDEDRSFPKNNYKNYEHFAGVIGKFNPYLFCLRNPVDLENLDFETIYAAAKPHSE